MAVLITLMLSRPIQPLNNAPGTPTSVFIPLDNEFIPATH